MNKIFNFKSGAMLFPESYHFPLTRNKTPSSNCTQNNYCWKLQVVILFVIFIKFYFCIFHVKNVFLQIWRSNLRWNSLLPLKVKWSFHDGRWNWSIRWEHLTPRNSSTKCIDYISPRKNIDLTNVVLIGTVCIENRRPNYHTMAAMVFHESNTSQMHFNTYIYNYVRVKRS